MAVRDRSETAGGARVAGRPVSLDVAIEAAADVLVRARLPLVWGLTGLTVEAQREAVRLADLLGAAIDPAGSAGRAPDTLALQQLGRLTATFGEVRARADVIVCWGVDPEAAQPGFLERYVAPAAQAPGRRIVAVDVGAARGPVRADERFTVWAEHEFETVWTLRALLRASVEGERAHTRLTPAAPQAYAEDAEQSTTPEHVHAADRAATFGPAVSEPARLAGILKDGRYVVVFYDGDPPPQQRDPLRVAALSALVFDVDRITRARLMPIRVPGNRVGAENVIGWQTGYPFAVHFGRGYPRYGPDEFTAEVLLSRGDTDAVLVAGEESAGPNATKATERSAPAAPAPVSAASAPLSATALDALGRIPTIVVGAPGVASSAADIWIETAPYEETIGSVYRMDGIALVQMVDGTRPAAAPARPSATLVLERLAAAVHGLLRAAAR